MRFESLPHVLIGLCLFLTMVMIGCSGSDPNEANESQGTSTIRGNISSFEGAETSFVPLKQETKGFVASLFSGLSEMLVPSACAAGNREGIVVFLDGPVSRVTTTAADGSFAFSELPAGTYALRFEYDGEEVTYRGNSGQVATITVGEGEIVDLINIRISGGKVNIGNIRVVQPDATD